MTHQELRDVYSKDGGIVDSALREGLVVQATGNAGDVLLMNPFLVHSSSSCCRGNPVRISFNVSTKRIKPFAAMPFFPRPLELPTERALKAVKALACGRGPGATRHDQ